MGARTFAQLAVASADLASDDEILPTEFRLFRAGLNRTTKGAFWLDTKAADRVMASYRERGVDLMIDLEHDSINPDARERRSDAGDALGWFGLELRSGELWAVNVTWTPEGARRLREKTQRYTSPAFYDDADGRLEQIINVALCANPATFNADPLVSASQRKLTTMDPENIKAALEALASEDGAKALEILKALVTAAASGEAGESGEPAEAPAVEPMAETPAVPPEDEEKATALRALAAIVGRESSGEIVAEVKALRAMVDKIEVERAALELSARRELVGTLVKLGVELPATAWEGDATAANPVKRLRDEPIADLRKRVALLADRPAAPAIAPPAKTEASDLGESEQRMLASLKTPEAKTRFLAMIAGRKA